jgi:hypothetical protein
MTDNKAAREHKETRVQREIRERKETRVEQGRQEQSVLSAITEWTDSPDKPVEREPPVQKEKPESTDTRAPMAEWAQPEQRASLVIWV